MRQGYGTSILELCHSAFVIPTSAVNPASTVIPAEAGIQPQPDPSRGKLAPRAAID